VTDFNPVFPQNTFNRFGFITHRCSGARQPPALAFTLQWAALVVGT